MADGREEGAAFLFAGPAGGLEVDAPWVGAIDLGLPAEFEEAARALDGRAWGVPACVGGSGFAARFVVPADAGVEGSYLVEVSGPSHAQS